MPETTRLPNHLRPRREKVFGAARGIPLDGNAKARIMVYARAYNAKHRQPGQHRGPLTRAIMEVLEALLWHFHNSKSGLCFPAYEAIAVKAECCRDTVYEAIKALEDANILTWVNRIWREQVRERDLFGKWVTNWRIIRTSNAYLFRDPLPCAEGREGTKSENPAGTLNQDISVNKKEAPAPTDTLTDMDKGLLKALHSLGTAIADREGVAVT
ncbi:MAG: helix-turn-helix domain-containing protein [Alphaproteobacteria bacterium]|nr:helix-turn-helix domain-containing protein [Alphaproteobacteria bacterium]